MLDVIGIVSAISSLFCIKWMYVFREFFKMENSLLQIFLKILQTLAFNIALVIVEVEDWPISDIFKNLLR